MVKKILEPFLQPKSINPQHGVFSIDLVLIMIVSIITIPYIFYNIRNLVPHPVESTLKLKDYYILLILLVYIVIGVYQQYFWTKTNKLREKSIIHTTKLDDFVNSIFGINDNWTYIYNFIYYFCITFFVLFFYDD